MFRLAPLLSTNEHYLHTPIVTTQDSCLIKNKPTGITREFSVRTVVIVVVRTPVAAANPRMYLETTGLPDVTPPQ